MVGDNIEDNGNSEKPTDASESSDVPKTTISEKVEDA